MLKKIKGKFNNEFWKHSPDTGKHFSQSIIYAWKSVLWVGALVPLAMGIYFYLEPDLVNAVSATTTALPMIVFGLFFLLLAFMFTFKSLPKKVQKIFGIQPQPKKHEPHRHMLDDNFEDKEDK
jgi:hypothetical protein